MLLSRSEQYSSLNSRARRGGGEDALIDNAETHLPPFLRGYHHPAGGEDEGEHAGPPFLHGVKLETRSSSASASTSSINLYPSAGN